MLTREKKLESMLVIAAGFMVFFLIFKVKWILLVALLIALIGAFSKVLTHWVTWAWFKLSEILGWVNARILLGIVFYIFLFPMAMIMRMTTKVSLKLKKEKNSYYTERDHLYTNKDLENTW